MDGDEQGAPGGQQEQADEQAQQSTDPGQVSGTSVAASLGKQPPGDGGTGLQPDAIRQSPEYQELQRQNRELARQAGTLRAEHERFRREEEARRQAAEAQQVREMQQQMQDALGDRTADFADFAQLLQDDPVEAARRFARLGTAQSVPPPTPPEGEPAGQQGEGGPVGQEPQSPRVPTPGGMSVGAAPIGQPSQQQARDQRVEELTGQYQSVVDQNQNLQTRTRVTQRMRDIAMGAFLRRGYIQQHDIDPELVLPQRNPR